MSDIIPPIPPRATRRARARSGGTRATFRSLRSRNYRLFWSGQLLSLIGTWMAEVALAWLVLSLTDSPVLLGAAMTVRFAPTLLLSLFGGVLADRFPKRRVLLITQSVLLVQALGMALLTTTGAIRMVHVYLLAGLRGMADSLDIPTRQAFVVEMVGPGDLQNAVALNSTQFNVARIVGPAIGGLVVAGVGVAPCFWLNAASFAAVLGALLGIRTRDLYPVTAAAKGRVLRQVGEGLAYAARTPDIALLLALVAVVGTFGYNFTVMLPLLAKYGLGTGADGLGALTSSMGAGSLIAAVYVASRGRPSRRTVLAGAGGFGMTLLLLGFASHQLEAMGLLVIVGLFGILFHTTANTRLQLLAPGEMRGRIMSMYALLFIGSTPLGSLIVGTLAEHFGIRHAILGLGSVCLLGAGAALLFTLRLRKRVPSPVLGALR